MPWPTDTPGPARVRGRLENDEEPVEDRPQLLERREPLPEGRKRAALHHRPLGVLRRCLARLRGPRLGLGGGPAGCEHVAELGPELRSAAAVAGHADFEDSGAHAAGRGWGQRPQNTR